MKRLTGKEEEIMYYFWEKGPLFVRELVEFYPEPRPHFNTISTMVRSLEEKGYVAHEAFGNSYRYYATVNQEAYSAGTLRGVVKKYFNNSYLRAVSQLIKEDELSVEELKKLIDEVERNAHQGSNQ